MAHPWKHLTTTMAERPVRTVVRPVLFLVVIVGLAHYQDLLDTYTLATYHAPADIATLEAPLALTRTGQAIADRARPQIDSKAQFNIDCETQKGELELGCYAHGRIYVLNIDNVSLKPEMQTVLAHELLHAAWDRLSVRSQTALGTALENTYHGLNDTDLSARMADYARTEPGEESNELHSILGSEQPTLPAVLEAHYDTYFSRRSNVVAAHQAYEAVFTSRGAELATQLATIKGLKTQLTATNARMERYKASNQIAAYNALVPTQNALVDQINGLIDAYDTAVDEYNALSGSIDSQQVDTEPGV